MSEMRMTKYSVEELECPKCGKKHSKKKFSFINVTEKPDMREEILKNHIFQFSCDKCGLVAPLTYENVYWDSKKKLCIYLAPVMEEEQREKIKQLESEKGFTKRIVDNINDLKEKIMIAENHLDDRIIELVKIQYLGQLEKEMVNDTLMNILFDYSGEQMCFIVFFEKKGIGKIPLTMDFYRNIESKYASQVKAHSTDTFMKIDMEWAGNIMFKRN